MHSLTLLVGGAFWSGMAGLETRFPCFELVLSRSQSRIHRQTSTAGWLCEAFGIKRRPDWPVGAILAHNKGPDTGETYWLCADPVHMKVRGDSLILAPRSHLNLTGAESQALFDALEAHFSSTGLSLVHAGSGQWCVGVAKRPHLVTSDLDLVEGEDIGVSLPSGQDGPVWRRHVTEAQMILHEHPVNMAREARGEAVANSIWLWGGGIVPEVKSTFDAISAATPLVRDIGNLSGTKLCGASQSNVDFSLPGRFLVEFPEASVETDDAWLSRLESNWIAPAWRALGSGQLKEIVLVMRLGTSMFEFSCNRSGRRRFWKRRRSLSAMLAKLQDTL